MREVGEVVRMIAIFDFRQHENQNLLIRCSEYLPGLDVFYLCFAWGEIESSRANVSSCGVGI
jgi:hypothetical protein